MKLRPLTLMLVLGSAWVSGCFGMLGGGGPKSTATVQVLNYITPPATLSIELRRDGDKVATLGSVEPNQAQSLRYTSRNLQGSYQLVAEQPSGAAVVSREFTLFRDAQVQWQVRGNSLSVIEPR